MICQISVDKLGELKSLFMDYRTFYGVHRQVDAEVEEFLVGIVNNSKAGIFFGYFEGDHLLGFATVYFCYSSVSMTSIAILNDLYVKEENRLKGIGTRLIEHCKDYCSNNGISRLQWLSKKDNHLSGQLYRKFSALQADWQYYKIDTSGND